MRGEMSRRKPYKGKDWNIGKSVVIYRRKVEDQLLYQETCFIDGPLHAQLKRIGDVREQSIALHLRNAVLEEHPGPISTLAGKLFWRMRTCSHVLLLDLRSSFWVILLRLNELVCVSSCQHGGMVGCRDMLLRLLMQRCPAMVLRNRDLCSCRTASGYVSFVSKSGHSSRSRIKERPVGDWEWYGERGMKGELE